MTKAGERLLSTARGMGKTLAMVKSLEPHSIVIVHNFQMRRYLFDMIMDIRGLEFAKSIFIQVLDNMTVYGLKGRTNPIAVDHYVRERAIDNNLSDYEREDLQKLEEFLQTRPAR